MTERFNEGEEPIILVDEEGGEHEFYLIDTLTVADAQYVVLAPAEEDEENEGEVVILKIAVDEEGNEVFSEIEDDEEWELVADAWEESEEGNELIEIESEVVAIVAEAPAGDRCSYCNESILPAEEAASCTKCGANYHAKCFEKAGGCTHQH